MNLEKAFDPYELLHLTPEEIRDYPAEHEDFLRAWRMHRRRRHVKPFQDDDPIGVALLDRAVETCYPWQQICYLVAEDITRGNLRGGDQETTLSGLTADYRQRAYAAYPGLRQRMRRKLAYSPGPCGAE